MSVKPYFLINISYRVIRKIIPMPSILVLQCKYTPA